MKNEVFLENFIESDKVLEYDYVYSGLPCYNDLAQYGADLNDPPSYKKALKVIMDKLKPKLGTITVSFTDRRYNSQVLPKHIYLHEVMVEAGYYLRDLKYIIKSMSYNAFRHQATPTLTFQHKDIKGKFNIKKADLYKTYGPDFWVSKDKEQKLYFKEEHDARNGEILCQPLEYAANCILNFTDPGDTVLDPFIGAWTTAIAAKKHGRNYLGFEINKEVWEFGKGLMEKSTQTLF